MELTKTTEIFFFVLSTLYCIRYLIEFFLNVQREDPVPMKVGKVNQILLYLAISYIVTSIIEIFL